MEFSAQQLPQLEAMCTVLYTSQNPQERSQADQALKVFGTLPEYMAHCKTVLDNSSSPYAQVFAASSMLKLVTEHTLSLSARIEMRAYFLRYLDERGPSLEPYVVTSLVQLLCRMTKLGWFEDDAMRPIADEGKVFLDKGVSETSEMHYFLGLKILTMAVSEMNCPCPGRTLTQHRKVAVSFRDRSLFQIYQMSLNALAYLKRSSDNVRLMEQAMSLSLACLSFDFVGTCIDDSTEDLGTIQIPSSWRSVVEDASTLETYFEYYSNSQPPLSNKCLECLVRMASVRRSLFSSEVERIAFLGRLIRGTRDILSSQRGLQHHENYHEFCRLLGRLKTNYQLSELVGLEAYPEWTSLVADFTIQSLKSWQWASASVFYLLGLWSRLVSSMPYLKGDKPSLLEAQVPRITQAYIESRLLSVTAQGGGPDALDEEEHLEDQLDSLPYLCRFQYAETAAFITHWMDPCLSQYQAESSSTSGQLDVIESQLTWLVHIVSAVIRGRVSSSGAEAYEQLDGDLAARVFTIIAASESTVHSQRHSIRSKQRLELALISFLQSFRRAYIGEQVVHSSKVYTRLREKCGIADHIAVMNALLGKICFNLKVYGSCEEVINATLGLFQDLAAGYMSGKVMLKLDAVSMLLQHHTSEYFPFLSCAPNSKCRTTYYLTLGRLLFMEDTPGAFDAFVQPLGQVLSAIASASAAASSVEALKASVPKETVVGIFRDLRGITAATTNRRTYGLVFEWLYPTHFPVIITCLDAWADTPEVSNAILKFLAEFVHNKTQRLTFDSSSANGILLFREVSKALCAYGNRILSLPPPSSDPYGQRFKGIWISCSILTKSLSGNYVNFGVFDLYGDPALRDALDVCLKMLLGISTQDILGYKKLAKAYYAFVDSLCHNHVPALAKRDDSIFASIIAALEAGIKSLDVSISSQCASAIDNLAGYYFKHKPDGPKPNETGLQLQEHLARHPDAFPRVLSTLFDVVLFEDCSNQWSLSRPMLTLILVTESVYSQIRQQVIQSQPADRQPAVANCLDKLMTDVKRTLDAKNRDKFTQNLTVARHDLKTKQ
eukprot:CAMPEP_0118799344 /NCGR_PEP_ID=MMETSP1161-20130426/1583_1 /TAXON_ID=249345 /ORGANISM="Picochlorum oklahomensis, Strain CCMP2329" /LENGTH=1059 /DNA_ID=CAMNT_0006727019 /DNA_START=220 /DNA_END=3399 /DNA_ORIENTATION=-